MFLEEIFAAMAHADGSFFSCPQKVLRLQQHTLCLFLYIVRCPPISQRITIFLWKANLDVLLWELPPNGQGMVALEMLNILKNIELGKMRHNSAEYLHTLIETTKVCFKDSMAYCSDPSIESQQYANVLNDGYGKLRASEINPNIANHDFKPGDLAGYGHDTVYLTVVDEDGNACSFINSIFMSFGSSIVPKNCGFALQNRGAGFSLDPDSPNVVAPSKRPYHTIIPAMLTNKSGHLLMSFGVMGGFMQPQGHVQVLLNMVEFGMGPQEALDSPRYLVGDGYLGPDHGISLEDGILEKDIVKLKSMGHRDINEHVSGFDRMKFGKGQIIAVNEFWKKGCNFKQGSERVLWSGTDPRSDGMAIGY